ncbi:MAG: hypothetical protein HC767_09545, partial [Akkermansiaceae bacterium]|nr:hypothetical protein [Akkermansiaceae bacterium]
FNMHETWVKDVLDTKGEVAALQEFKRLRDYESISYRKCFDPAEPERPQFEFRHRKDESEDAAAFKKLVDEGFRFYRPDAPKPETREVVTTTPCICHSGGLTDHNHRSESAAAVCRDAGSGS